MLVRPADIFAEGWIDGRRTAVDVIVISPTEDSGAQMVLNSFATFLRDFP